MFGGVPGIASSLPCVSKSGIDDNNADICFTLAYQIQRMCSTQNSVKEEQEPKLAIIQNLFEESAQKGNSEAKTAIAMLTAAKDPEKSYQLLREAANADNAEANRTLADLYMHSMNSKMQLNASMSVEVFNVLLAGVKQKIDNLENDDKIRLIIDYIKKSGSLELDVYEFYKNIETRSDDLSRAVMDHMSRSAIHAIHPRNACDSIAEQLDIQISDLSRTPQNAFPESMQGELHKMITDCYWNALLRGHDYPEISHINEDYSTSRVLYELYRSKEDADPSMRKKWIGAMIFGAKHGDGYLQGIMASHYKKGDIFKKDENRMHFWTEKAAQSLFCKKCALNDKSPDCEICNGEW